MEHGSVRLVSAAILLGTVCLGTAARAQQPSGQPADARCDAQGALRIATGNVPEWRSALPAGADAEVISDGSADVDGDGRADAIVAVETECEDHTARAIVVAWHGEAGWTVTSLREESETVPGRRAIVLSTGAERFVFFAWTPMTGDGLGSLEIYRFRAPRVLEAVQGLPEIDPCRELSLAPDPTGTVRVTCRGRGYVFTWDAAQQRFTATASRSPARPRPRRR